MGATHMIAYNPVSKIYLRRKKKTWYTTPFSEQASALPEAELRKGLACLGKDVSGGWMIMRQEDASKLAGVREATKSAPVVVKQSVVRKNAPCTRKTPQSEGCMSMIQAVKTVELLVSQERLQELALKQSEADKNIADIYHYIETTNLNACQGYKAYKKLQAALIERRRIKNEREVVNQIKRLGLLGGDYLTAIAERSFEPQTDIFSTEM